MYCPAKYGKGEFIEITTSTISGESGRIAVSVPARFAGIGTSSNTISASPSMVA
jgi:hypothetical protein